MTSVDALPPIVLRPPRPMAAVVTPLLAALVYYAGAEAAFAIGTLTQMFAPFWPPNVVLLCALLLAPERRWWAYVLAALPAHLAAELGVAMPLPQALMAFTCNVAVALLNAVALRRMLAGPPWLGNLRNASLYLLVAAVLSPALVAFAAGAEPIIGDGDPRLYWTYWWRWYLSNALGSLTLTPVFLTWFRRGTRRLRIAAARRWIEIAALTFGLVAACTIAFGAPTNLGGMDHFFPALLYVPVPLLLWSAVRFDGRGASGAILIVTVVALWSAMQGSGPFAVTAPGQSVLALQLFLAVISTPVVLLAAMVEELRETNRRFGAILHGISDGFYMLDRDWRFTVVNPRAASWLAGGLPRAILGRRYWEAVSDAAAPFVRQAAESGAPVHAQVPSVAPPGKWIDLHIYPSAEGVSVFMLDITERKRMQESLRESEEKFRAMAETVPDILFTSSPDRGCEYLSPRFFEYTGMPLSAAAGFGWAEALAVEDRERVMAARRRAARADESFAEECRLRGADGSYRWFVIRWRALRSASGRIQKWFGAMTDIDELKRRAEELRELAGELLAAEDKERRRIARELHDATGQNLIGAMLNVDRVLRQAATLPAGAEQSLRESRQLIEQSLGEIRTVSYLLHPPTLQVAGLRSALAGYVEGFTQRTGIPVDLDMAQLEERRLPDELEMALYRVVQEALTNVHRHSGSTTARIRVAHRPAPSTRQELITLEIGDQGHGIAEHKEIPEFAACKPGRMKALFSGKLGVGLAGMRERLAQLGGRLDIRSTARGTEIRAIVPLSKREGAATSKDETLTS